LLLNGSCRCYQVMQTPVCTFMLGELLSTVAGSTRQQRHLGHHLPSPVPRILQHRQECHGARKAISNKTQKTYMFSHEKDADLGAWICSVGDDHRMHCLEAA